MISEKDKIFMAYWEANRERESTFLSKLSRGFPMALIFSVPIILLILVVRLFFPDWYYQISKTSSGMFVTAVVAMFIITIFYAFFRMHYKWEMNEQLYQELKAKEKKANNLAIQVS